MKEIYSKYLKEDHSFDKMTLLGIFCLIIVIAGTFGFFYEVIFYFFNGGMKQLYWRGGNFLPWINIYATGAMIVYFLTYKYREKPLKVFLISAVACGLLEYISGLGIYLLLDGTRYWDYNVEILNFGNIGGFICFRSVLFFGFSSLFLIYAVVPLCFYLAKHMNKKTFLIMSFALCSITLIDEFYNLIFTKLFGLPKSTTLYKKLGIHYVKRL